jgi:protein-S-isoprenylcysteine O-methyltransferase Ste14
VANERPLSRQADGATATQDCAGEDASERVGSDYVRYATLVNPTPAALRRESLIAFALMLAGLYWLIIRREVFARSVPGLVVQAAAVALMIAARLTFGRRSFHAAANPTKGGLVTNGPYRWLRHPIYAAILYFIWSTAVDHRTIQSIVAALLVTAGAFVRMYAEESLLTTAYPEYATYRARTARVIPFVL